MKYCFRSTLPSAKNIPRKGYYFKSTINVYYLTPDNKKYLTTSGFAQTFLIPIIISWPPPLFATPYNRGLKHEFIRGPHFNKRNYRTGRIMIEKAVIVYVFYDDVGLTYTSGLNFINVLQTAFTLAGPKSVKKDTDDLTVFFYPFGIYECKSCT